MPRGGDYLLGQVAVGANAMLRPGPVVRWLSRRFPEVLFHQEGAGPLVALTFDDSPHETLTPRILDLLAEHEARATFFMIGAHIPGNEEVIRRLVAAGHELGNHMMSDSRSSYLAPDEFERQLRQTHELIAPFGPVRWFRPGHGWFDRRMLGQLQAHGYQCAMASAYSYEFLTISAPYARRMRRRSTLMSSGITRMQRYPRTAEIIASAIPVFPIEPPRSITSALPSPSSSRSATNPQRGGGGAGWFG